LGVYLYKSDKELLRKRLNSKEKEEEQRVYHLLSSISLLATFSVSGFDDRFGWSHVPPMVVVLALFIMIAGYGLFVFAMVQNRFASRVVEIQQEQIVVTSGVYSMVRHPMYTAAIVMFFSSPVVLGSYFATIPALFFLIGIVFRIQNEEKVLLDGLEGYAAYQKKVKYRLIPFVW